jgi:hydroxymethylbilane synthase
VPVKQGATLTIGTRGSKLALAQTDMVRAAIQSIRPDIVVEILRITTTGDRVQDRPLSQVGGKALFVTEIETALREQRIHIAVHSAKDIPSELPDDMRIAACLPRADARDVLISRVSSSIATLPQGAVVGTSSPRRASQLRALRPDLELRDIRGNVDTRLAKLHAGTYDATILAAAGLSRLGLLEHVTEYVSLDTMLPCGAQGAIAIEVSAGNEEVLQLIAGLDHAPTHIAITSERAFLETIGGTCETPLAAHATLDGDSITLRGMIGNSQGKQVSASASAPSAHAAQLGVELARQLLDNGGAALLAEDGVHLRGSSHGA